VGSANKSTQHSTSIPNYIFTDYSKKLSGGVLAWLFVWSDAHADATATHCLLLQ